VRNQKVVDLHREFRAACERGEHAVTQFEEFVDAKLAHERNLLEQVVPSISANERPDQQND
jgi:hypothetical protein